VQRDGKPLDIPSRRFFFFAASRKMRDILVERIRKEMQHTPTTPLDSLADQFLEDFRRETRWEFLAVHEALDRFTKSGNPRKRRRHELVELVYFAGRSVKAAAELLEISYSQARNDLQLAFAEVAVEVKRRDS
jgi:DNA-directed RNA polymerase specialized sigma24 family protein